MSLDNRKRQKKAERRKAKQRKRTVARRNTENISFKLQRAAAAPVLSSRVAECLFDQGIGMVMFSRKLADGNVAYAAFLVDVYCLGVKNVLFDIVSRGFYDEKIEANMFKDNPPLDFPPESVRKLVEGAVAYAADLGLTPHRDYAKARLLFGNIDAAASPDTFTYGREGKPFFITGPYDSQERCRRIVESLTARCGKGNFDYLVGSSGRGDISDLLISSHDNVLRIGRVVDFAHDNLDDDDDFDDENDGDDPDLYDEYEDDGYDRHEDTTADNADATEARGDVIDERHPRASSGGTLKSLVAAINPFRRRAAENND
ncbi:MAG: hypothetical protein WD875_04710 [Pirellulales bacterium]